MEEKQALEYLVSLGEERNPVVNLEQGTYALKSLNRIEEERAEALTLTSLTGLVDYIRTDIDRFNGDSRLLIQVESPTSVTLYGPLNQDRKRECFIRVKAIIPDNIVFSKFIDTERFNIMLQSSFEENKDRDILLKYTGLIQDDAVKTIGDNGISQAVTIKTGVASVGQAEVPNPVRLAPYRTFLDVKQPESRFIFRMQEGPSAALFEADGGAWRYMAMRSIKEFLIEELKEISYVEIIA